MDIWTSLAVPPANAGNTDRFNPWPGKSLPAAEQLNRSIAAPARCPGARERQPPSLCAATSGAHTLPRRSPRSEKPEHQNKGRPASLPLEEAHAQQRSPSAAKKSSMKTRTSDTNTPQVKSLNIHTDSWDINWTSDMKTPSNTSFVSNCLSDRSTRRLREITREICLDICAFQIMKQLSTLAR